MPPVLCCFTILMFFHDTVFFTHSLKPLQLAMPIMTRPPYVSLQLFRLFPHALIGHSYGGKVAMSMAAQFGAQLPRPVQVSRAYCICMRFFVFQAERVTAGQ